MSARHIGQSISLTHEFDTAGRLASEQVWARGQSLKHRAYTYRADGNLIGIHDSVSGARHFELDAIGRVTAVDGTHWTETYAYDQAGNQTQAAWPVGHPGHEATGERTYTGTRLTRAGRVRYEHDAQGRIVLRQKTRLSRAPETWRYTWDSEDRLTSVTTPDGAHWRYLYDPLGRRMAKQRLQAQGDAVIEEVSFTWDGTTLCEQITSAEALANPVALTWDHDGLRPLTQTERILSASALQDTIDERFFAVVTDLIGTPTELIDESGSLAWYTRSTLWGTTTWSATSIAYTPLRFPGQYFDPETGLHYNFHRHYDPETARYLSVDPLGIAPSPNSGAYVENPHTGADPFGLAPCPEVNPRKLDYLFNKDVKPDPHNTPRAIQNANQLKSIGFHDTPASRQFVTEHLKEATGNGFSEHFTNEWGNFGKTKSVLYGPHGMLGVESTWQIMPDGGYRLSTVIFRS